MKIYCVHVWEYVGYMRLRCLRCHCAVDGDPFSSPVGPMVVIAKTEDEFTATQKEAIDREGN